MNSRHVFVTLLYFPYVVHRLSIWLSLLPKYNPFITLFGYPFSFSLPYFFSYKDLASRNIGLSSLSLYLPFGNFVNNWLMSCVRNARGELLFKASFSYKSTMCGGRSFCIWRNLMALPLSRWFFEGCWGMMKLVERCWGMMSLVEICLSGAAKLFSIRGLSWVMCRVYFEWCWETAEGCWMMWFERCWGMMSVLERCLNDV